LDSQIECDDGKGKLIGEVEEFVNETYIENGRDEVGCYSIVIIVIDHDGFVQ